MEQRDVAAVLSVVGSLSAPLCLIKTRLALPFIGDLVNFRAPFSRSARASRFRRPHGGVGTSRLAVAQPLSAVQTLWYARAQAETLDIGFIHFMTASGRQRSLSTFLYGVSVGTVGEFIP